MRHSVGVAASVMLAASLMVTPASAQSLLGGLLENDLITLNNGPAESTGVVNLGIGGGDGNLVDVDILPSSSGSVATVDVGTNRGGALDADIGLLNDNARVTASVGGPGLVDVGIGIGGPGGPGDPGGPGGPGRPGGPGGPGAPGILLPGGGSGSSGSSGFASACAGQDASALARLIAQTNYSQNDLRRWQSSTGVEVVPVRFCADIMAQLRNMASATNLGAAQNMLATDPLLGAALNRSGKGINDILAVNYNNRMLTVYVR